MYKKLILYIEKYKAQKKGIDINNFLNLKKNSYLEVESPVSLGDTRIMTRSGKEHSLFIGAHSYMRSGEIQNVSKIGRYCSIGQNVILGLNKRTHPIDWASTSVSVCEKYKRFHSPLVIGNDVWIGQGAVIMSGIEIGTGAIIGSNTVVSKNVKPYQIVAGNPQKEIRYRFEANIISRLLESQWWLYPFQEIKNANPENVENFLKQIKTLDTPETYSRFKIEKRKFYTN